MHCCSTDRLTETYKLDIELVSSPTSSFPIDSESERSAAALRSASATLKVELLSHPPTCKEGEGAVFIQPTVCT